MTARAPDLKDRLVTFFGMLTFLSLAGAIGEFSVPDAATAWAASAAFMAMIAAYSVWTGPGRRSETQVYMAGVVALLPLTFILLIFLDSIDRYDLLAWLMVGGSVGYNPGGMDSGAVFGWFIWWLTIFVLTAVSLTPRFFADDGK